MTDAELAICALEKLSNEVGDSIRLAGCMSAMMATLLVYMTSGENNGRRANARLHDSVVPMIEEMIAEMTKEVTE